MSFSIGGSPCLIRSSFTTAWLVATQVKKASMNTSPTIGTLSGFITIEAKFSSAIDSPMRISRALRTVQATIGFTKNLRNTKSTVSSAVVPSVYSTGPDNAFTSFRAASGSDGTSVADPESARLARIIIRPATTAQVRAQPSCFF